MYKASIELCKISRSMKLTFNLILQSDVNPASKYYMSKIIDKFNYNGSTYLKLNPRPFLTIDISSPLDKGEAWSSNNQVNLNKQYMFILSNHLKRIREVFKIENLFYYENKKLYVNKKISLENREIIKCGGNKTIVMYPVVVYDEENSEIAYEGLCFMINSIDFFTTITYDEMIYLIHELDTIDLYTLSVHVINTNLILNKTDRGVQTRELKIDKVIEEKDSEPEIKNTSYAKIKEPSEVPKL